MPAIALCLFLLQAPSAFAADAHAQATPLDVLCARGQVIDHEEEPLDDWTVTATFTGDPSAFDPITDESNSSGRFRIDLPAPGQWTFALTVPPDWEGVTATQFQVDVAYGSTECVDIRFKVQRVVTVTVLKIDDDHNPLPDWTITATPGPGNRFAEEETATTDENGLAFFQLTPGQWIFTEEAPNYVSWWIPVAPADGVQEVNVTAPGPHVIRFKNRLKGGAGCIEVIKRDVPPAADDAGNPVEPFGLPDWPIEVLRADGSVAASGETDAFGRIRFSDLPFGPYTVRETVLPGWEPVTPTAYEVVLARSDESCQVIEFNNRQVENGFCIAGYKRDENGDVGIPDWEINAEPTEDGDIDPSPVLTNGEGKFRIDFPLDDYRVPRSTYEVCEDVQSGWTAVSETCYTVTLPKYPGACVYTPDFVNKQTQTEAEVPTPDDRMKRGDKYDGRPNHGGPGYSRRWDGPGGCRTHHTVRRGESLYKIAPRYDMSVQELIVANPWVRGQRNMWLYTGQELCIR